MTSEPIPLHRELPQHDDVPREVREKAGELDATMNRIKRALLRPAVMPEVREAAKDELVSLARDALVLRGML